VIKTKLEEEESSDDDPYVIDDFYSDSETTPTAVPSDVPDAVLETETLWPPEEEERKVKLDDMGHSLDSKWMSDAIGYIDQRLMCWCFAKAVMKHIDYS